VITNHQSPVTNSLFQIARQSFRLIEALPGKVIIFPSEMPVRGGFLVDGPQQVQVLGVPRDVLDSEVMALRAAGVNPRILDLKTMALVRAVNREQALILNIESTSFDTVVVVNGVASSPGRCPVTSS